MSLISERYAAALFAIGEDKKKIVIDTVKASCKAAGIDVNLFVDQLADYIDQTITFVNGMKKASTK